MFAVKVIKPDSPDYIPVITLAEEIYQEELGVYPVAYPNLFIALFHHDKPVGSVGIWTGTEQQEFLTEKYALANPERRRVILEEIYKVTDRKEMAEAVCFNISRPYRQAYAKPLIAYMFVYLTHMGFRALFLTQGVTVKRLMKQLGPKWETICKADIRYYLTTEENKAAWEVVYFQKLKPECALIRIFESKDQCLAWLRTHKDEYQPIDTDPLKFYLAQNAPSRPILL